jgi:molybdate transport system ATP-binding protein
MLEVTLKKRFVANRQAAFKLDVSFAAGEGITVLFGPSGSGKTTTLRAISGIVTPDEGKIALDGRVFFDSQTRHNLPIQQRKVGFVFQDYLLFPHRSAAENVAYGIGERNGRARLARAMGLLELVGIGYAAARRPAELSGGEQQRVALARALGSDPGILLLDEPLSAVDATTRRRLLEEIVAIQRRTKIPFLYVTHSPADAVRAGDTALMISAGKIVQQGGPLDVFNAPTNAAAARAAGEDNILLGRVTECDPAQGIASVETGGCRVIVASSGVAPGDRVTLALRADDIIVSREPVRRTSARNLLCGRAKSILRDGGRAELIAACGVDLRVRLTLQAVEALEITPGAELYLLFKANACRLLD